jgi:hemin uptake protein HemP
MPTMMAKHDEPKEPAPNNVSSGAPRRDERVIDSRTLFGATRQVRITHNGESYSLRQTRLGKLILTK